MDNSREKSHPRGIVVTGGGTGIGRATARAFADRGDQVLVIGRSGPSLDETARGHPLITSLIADLTDPAAAEQVVGTALSRFGRLDVLVNNAAQASFQQLAELDADTVRAVIAVNLLAPILLTQQALAALQDGGGTVINVSSAGAIGLRGMPNSSVYAATKTGLDSLTRSWAVELAPLGIRVVSVAPGLIDTGVAVRAGMPAADYDAFLVTMAARVPNGRIGRPEDVAWWIAVLTDPGAGYLNGALVPVDGGLSVT